MLSSKLFLVLAFLVCGSLCTLHLTKDGIYNVTEDNFEEFMEFARSKNATFYMKFFSPMCAHCQTLKPLYIEANNQLKNDPDGVYLLSEVNTMFHERLGKHFNIKGIPTIYVFSPVNDYMPIIYSKNRTVFDLVTEIELASGLISKELNNYAEFEHRYNMRDEDFILGIFKDRKAPLFEEMEEIKKDFNYVRMYYTFNVEEFKQKLNLPAGDNFILMIHNKKFIEPADSKYTIYDKKTYSDIKNFIINEYPYDIEILNDRLEAIYAQRNLPRAVLFTPFANRTKEVQLLALQMKPLAQKYKGKLNLYIQDADSRTAKRFKFSGNATYMIFNTDGEKYRYLDKVFDNQLDIAELIKFTENFFAGKLIRYIRSAEVNKDDLGEPVFPVVAKTYNEVVLDPKKHVFVRFYDKMIQRYAEQFAMRKEWWKVGRNFTNNKKDILITEIETNDNDVSDFFSKKMQEGKNFFLFTKKNKKEPIVYTGKPVAEELIKFINDIVEKEEPAKKVDL